MEHTITIALPDEVIQPLREIARLQGKTLEEFIRDRIVKVVLPRQRLNQEAAQQAEERFTRWIGSVSLGYPTGADNESIDADLAREYASTHEDEDRCCLILPGFCVCFTKTSRSMQRPTGFTRNR
jgi:hypothetical protein